MFAIQKMKVETFSYSVKIACAALRHMQSIPPQSGVMPCGLRGYRRGKARSLRSRACGLGYTDAGLYLY
jgi:hypothetical protein